LVGYPAGYPAILFSGIRPDIRPVRSGIRPDTGYRKRPDYPAGYPAGRISGASLKIKFSTGGAEKLGVNKSSKKPSFTLSKDSTTTTKLVQLYVLATFRIFTPSFVQLLGQTLVNVDIDHLDSLDPELYKNLLYLKVQYPSSHSVFGLTTYFYQIYFNRPTKETFKTWG
jgi:hypothetical protein